MPITKKNLTFSICIFLVWLFIGQPTHAQQAISEKLLPTDLLIEDIFQAGVGLPVGKIQAVRGEVIVYHRDPNVGYPVKTGLPLYHGDTISTRSTGRILCRLVDGTIFTLAPKTTLTILQCNLNSARNTSMSFLSLKHGDGRFQVKPPTELYTHEFKIQTVTAFVQTRSADFVVKTQQNTTEIFTFENNRLEFTNLAAPEVMFILTDFQKTVVGDALGPQMAENLSQADVDAVLKEVGVAPQSHLFASSTERYDKIHTAASELKAPNTIEENLEDPTLEPQEGDLEMEDL
jgi:hypothetical protein